MMLQMNGNRFYKNYVNGMDESGSSFYIDSLKTQMHKKRMFENKQKELRRVESLDEQLNIVKKGSISLKEVVKKTAQSAIKTPVDDNDDIIKVINTKRGPKLLRRDQGTRTVTNSYKTLEAETAPYSHAPNTSRPNFQSKSSLTVHKKVPNSFRQRIHSIEPI